MTDRASAGERDEDALFVENGDPIKFCFHKSVTQGRGRITRDVERHGGQIVAHERHANVLLVDEQEDIALLRLRYYSSSIPYRLSLYVERRGFIKQCIRSGSYGHVAPAGRRMPGLPSRAARGGRRARVPFTEDDRDKLAYYLATRCPTRDGRMGNSAYKDLERLGQTDDLEWAWARRHTFHSWREHYKMNPEMMDARIDTCLRQLKDVGHHFGQDPRTRNPRRLREEEEEGGSEDEEEEQQQGVEQRDRGRREQVRPAVARERRRDQAARHERDPVAAADQEDEGMQEDEDEVVIVEHVKRRRVLPDTYAPGGSREAEAKRARVAAPSKNGKQAAGVKANRGEANQARTESTDGEESSELEGSDLFGDHAQEDGHGLDFNDMEEIEFPKPISPRTSPIPERDAPPPSTQATLIASPRFAETEHASGQAVTPTKVVEVVPRPTSPPSPERMLVTTEQRVAAQGVRVRGASAQPGPSMSKEAREQAGAIANVPHRNTRARSRSAGPQVQAQPESQVSRKRKDQGDGGEGQAKEVLGSIEEDVHVEEMQEVHPEEDAIPTSGVIRETFEDEMDVEGMLETSIDGGTSVGQHDELDEESEEDDLPRFQDIVIDDDPSDSDDAETHASLVQGAAQEGPAGGGEAPEKGDGHDSEGEGADDEEEEEVEDADRIEQMASRSLHIAPAPSPPRARVTRSMTATQQNNLRRTRSGNQTRAVLPATEFPSPGTKARAVVDRFRAEERGQPYAPPMGTRAAKAAKGKGRRG